ncbi:MAG: thioesterase family protein [Gammaproteobacteria bacterium]|nr:thioesterase family protein [Gammaproteobacteria bacterium]
MARIQIDLPIHFPFTTELAVYVSHINYGGHLDNVQLLSLVSEAQMRLFAELGWPQGRIGDVVTLIADAAVQYRSEAFRGETMVVRIAAHDFNPKGCDLVWQMTEESSGREVARGKTGIVCFDLTTRKLVAIPEGFRQRLEGGPPG